MNDNIEQLDLFKGQWFVANCNSGREEKVRTDLIQKIESMDLSDQVFDVRISKTSVMNKSKKVIDKNKFPGYIFINMYMTDETWFIIRNTPGVNGFIGSSGKGAKPLPLTSEEVARMLGLVENKKPSKGESEFVGAPKQTEKKEKVLFTADFKIGDVVLIKQGAFENTEGEVVDMDYERGIAKINVDLFGRLTKTEIEFDSAEIAYKL